MLIIPAIDIKNGCCVRLTQGDPNQETVYSNSPVQQAKIWESKGAKLIHIVDLDGAFEGIPKNIDLIQDIRNSVKVDIEIGGGIRDIRTIEKYMEIGIQRIIVGSAAYKDKDFLKDASKRYSKQLIVGIDVMNYFVAIHGWKDITDTHLYDFAKIIKDHGIKELIVTDIKQDGMLTGINVDFYDKILENTKMKIIASGGVSQLNDVKRLIPLEKKGLKGVIIGKALYEKKLELGEALEEIHAG